MPRKMLRRFVGIWLLWQSFAIAGPALAVWTSSVLECKCSHGDGATCPMHKTPAGRDKCALRSTAVNDASALLSLIESIAPTPLTVVSHMPSVSSPLELDDQMAIDRPFDPDPRPPRA